MALVTSDTAGPAGSGSELDDERLTLMGLVGEASRGLSSTLERRLEREVGLSLQWFELLLRLGRSPGHRLRMSDLALQTGLTPSGLTRAVDRLHEAGLVERVACPSDRRVAYAALTAAGLGRITAAVPPHLSHIDELLGGALSSAERDQLADLLRKVRDHVNPGAATVTADEGAPPPGPGPAPAPAPPGSG
jgi:DNA-binding MarR family transcriptional regulator